MLLRNDMTMKFRDWIVWRGNAISLIAVLGGR